MLPSEIIDKIVLYTGEINALETLRHAMTPIIYHAAQMTHRKILIYGQIQSGKTQEIINITLKNKYKEYKKIIVVQNTLLVLQQYIARFKEQGLDSRVQIVDAKTQEFDKNKDIILLVHNKYRYNHFLRARTKTPIHKYVLILDEADISAKHALAQNEEEAMHIYYVTATPKTKLLSTPEFFHKVHRIQPTEDYHGLNHIDIQFAEETPDYTVEKYANQTQETRTMLLINSIGTLSKMKTAAELWSIIYPDIPIVLVTTEKSIRIGNNIISIGKKSIQKIIDSLAHFPKIIFIANRLSTRGLSYVSSDYTRHLTHQFSNFKNIEITNALQKMRILGKYKDTPTLTLIVPENNRRKIKRMFDALQLNAELCAHFNPKNIL